MSFTLELFHAPRLLTLAEAVAFTETSAPIDEAMRQRFARFARFVLRAYPDRCDTDEDGDDPANAWVDAPNPASADAAVWVIGPKTDAIDEAFMAHVAMAAAAADLHVLDPQNAMLYRPDRTLVQRDGRPRRVPAPPAREAQAQVQAKPASPPPATAPSHARASFDDSAITAYLHERFVQRFAHRGFALGPKLPRDTARAQRQQGLVQQRLWFFAMLRDGEMMLSVSLQLSSEPLAQVWQRLLGDEVAGYVALVRQHGLQQYDADIYTDDLEPGAPAHRELEIGRMRFGQAADLAGVDRWQGGLFDWLDAGGMAALDRIDRPGTLAPVMLTDWMHDRLCRNERLSPWQQFSWLVLVGAFAGFEDPRWSEAIFRHWERCHRHVNDWKTVLPDIRATLERLIAALRSPAFAAEAEALRAAR
jgi:hypothetical protein